MPRNARIFALDEGIAVTATSYQLWDLTTGNCAGAYADEATALAEVRQGVREDEIHPIADGAELVALALAATQLQPHALTIGSAD